MKTKLLAFLVATMLASPAFASNCATRINGITGLDEAVAQQLIVECETAKMAATDVSNAEETIDHYTKLAKASTTLARTVGDVARELGIATNEFIATPAGKIVTVIVAWKVFGDDLGSFFAFAFVVILSLVSWVVLTRRVMTSGYREVTYKPWFRAERVKDVRIPAKLNDDNYWTFWWVTTGCAASILIALFAVA